MAAKGRGRHQTTVVLVGMQVDQWEGLFRKGRQSALWGLALELMARTGEHRWNLAWRTALGAHAHLAQTVCRLHPALR